MKTGRLSRSNGIIADRVELEIRPDHRRSDGREGWYGEAWLSTDVIVIPGEHLQLHIDGGDAEEVVVDRVTVDSRAGRMLVRFHPVNV